jgi:uncharacterized protein (TIGR00369 family)
MAVRRLGTDFRRRVHASFERQRIMGLLGARLKSVRPGRVEIELPFREDLVQQDGFLHAGVVTTIADSAGGYAAHTRLEPGSGVLTVEYKLHFLEPAQGERFVAIGRVVKSGRTLTTCELEVVAVRGRRRTRCAWGTQTIFNKRAAPTGTTPQRS